MENIFEYRNDFEERYIDDVADFDCLEVRLFTERSTTNEPCNQDYICEFLITYGGPTVRFTVDSRYPMGELYHSWAVDHSDRPKYTVEVGKNVTNNFKDLIESMYAI
jgi:hypothetical protein